MSGMDMNRADDGAQEDAAAADRAVELVGGPIEHLRRALQKYADQRGLSDMTFLLPEEGSTLRQHFDKFGK